MAGEVTDPKVKTVIAAGGATAAGATLAAGKLASKNKKLTKRQPTKAQTRYAAQAKDTKVKTAQMKIDQLKSIKPKDLNARDVKVRNALLQQQKEILKGLTKTPAKELAKKYALRSIPFVGTFLSAIIPKPAGQGSALTGPGSKRKND
jgi:hypothetical protein